jgi:hypothetical protein
MAGGHYLPSGLPRLRRLWALPDVNVSGSLLDVHIDGPVVLGLSHLSASSIDLIAVEIADGRIRWRTALARSWAPALSVVGARALVHDEGKRLSAFDLQTGRPLWTTELDCFIDGGQVVAAGPDVAVARCVGKHADRLPGMENADALAIDMRFGAVRWRRPTQPLGEAIFVRDGQVFVRRGDARREYTEFVGYHLANATSGLWVLDGATGRVLREIRANPRGTRPSPSSTDPLAVISSATGLDALALIGSPRGDVEWPAEFERSWSSSYDAEFPLFSFLDGQLVLRGSRPLVALRDRVAELDLVGGRERATWRWPELGDFPYPSVLAMDLWNESLLVLLASDARKPGRLVDFPKVGAPRLFEAPALDPELVALTHGVLVARRRLSDRNVVLEGYSATEPEPASAASRSPTSELERVRKTIAGRGHLETVQCSPWTTRFDGPAAAALASIPNWEQHVATLLDDADPHVQMDATAAAVFMKSASVGRALLRQLRAPNKDDDAFYEDGHVWRGINERGWWEEVAGRRRWTRVRAAMALLEMNLADAFAPLAALVAETPELGEDHVSGCSSLVVAVCGLLDGSALPQAQAARDDYDHRLGGPGAWKALCEGARRL